MYKRQGYGSIQGQVSSVRVSNASHLVSGTVNGNLVITSSDCILGAGNLTGNNVQLGYANLISGSVNSLGNCNIVILSDAVVPNSVIILQLAVEALVVAGVLVGYVDVKMCIRDRPTSPATTR